jgi:hypothetical protein
MVNMKSTHKEVVHILAVKKLNAEFLHAVMKKVILELEEIRFALWRLISDHNSINRKTMSQFADQPEFLNIYSYKHQSLNFV